MILIIALISKYFSRKPNFIYIKFIILIRYGFCSPHLNSMFTFYFNEKLLSVNFQKSCEFLLKN